VLQVEIAECSSARIHSEGEITVGTPSGSARLRSRPSSRAEPSSSVTHVIPSIARATPSAGISKLWPRGIGKNSIGASR